MATVTFPELLTVAETAKLLSTGDQSVRNWMSEGLIPYVKLPSGQYRIPLRGLLETMEGSEGIEETLKKLVVSVL